MNDLNDLTYFKNLSDVQNEQIRQFIIQHEKTQSALLEEKQRVKELVDLLQKFNKKTDAYLKIYDGDKELFTYKIFANELIEKYGDV